MKNKRYWEQNTSAKIGAFLLYYKTYKDNADYQDRQTQHQNIHYVFPTFVNRLNPFKFFFKRNKVEDFRGDENISLDAEDLEYLYNKYSKIYDELIVEDKRKEKFKLEQQIKREKEKLEQLKQFLEQNDRNN